MIVKMFLLGEYDVPGIRLLAGYSRRAVQYNMLDTLLEIVEGTDEKMWRELPRNATVRDITAFREEALRRGGKNFQYNRQSGELRLLGRDWLVMGAGETGAHKRLIGQKIGVAVLEEASLLREKFVRTVFSRMVDDRARAYLVTNPGPPNHYLLTDFIENQKLQADGKVRHIRFTIDDNPHLSAEYKESLRSMWKGAEYRRYVLGEWVDVPEMGGNS
jgi:PBSX family phage terminase large subunit